MAVKGTSSPLQGLICEIVISVGQGICQGKVREFQKPLTVVFNEFF